MKRGIVGVFFLFFFLSLNSFAGKIPYELTDRGKISIDSLESETSIPWWQPVGAAGISLIPTALAIMPGSFVCTSGYEKDDCIIAGLIPGLISGLVSIGCWSVTIYSIWQTYQDSQKAKVPLVKAQLIKESYAFINERRDDMQEFSSKAELLQKTELLDAEFYRYINNNPASKVTKKKLAKKIIVANESAYFVQANAYVEKDKLGDYLDKEDVPLIADYLKTLTHVGSLAADHDAQSVVNFLLGTPGKQLRNDYKLFCQSLNDYRIKVTDYLAQVNDAKEIALDVEK